MTARTRVLVTNDDGVTAEGLRHLAAHLHAAGCQVTVAAPEADHSGCGTSRAVAPDGLVPLRRHRLTGLEEVPVHAVAAPPGLIVAAACQGAFGPAPDLVVAGINPGANIGPALLHSGTVGAALTASHHGRPAIAVSLTHGAPYHWATALDALAVLLPLLLPPRQGPPPLLNLNVPNVPAPALAGLRHSRIGASSDTRFTIQRLGPDLLRAHHQLADCDDGEAALLAAGYATVTPLGRLVEDTETTLTLTTPGPAPLPAGEQR